MRNALITMSAEVGIEAFPAPIRSAKFGGVRGVIRAVFEQELNRPLRPVDQQPAALGEVDGGLIGFRVVGEKDLPPAGAGPNVAHVNDTVRKRREEHTGFDIGLRARRARRRRAATPVCTI